jgi:putative heme-binding domain-containing protein
MAKLRARSVPGLIFAVSLCVRCDAGTPAGALPTVADGWAIEKITEAPRILFPTAVVEAPGGTLYLGSDPMDMPGPPTAPIDSVLAIKGGEVRSFADRLWSVMGLEWVDGTLYVVHAPFLSAFRDTNGDGKADERIDLMTGLGPRIPGFNGLNDHVASGVRLGIDGFLYIAVGDKGIPRGVARDGTTIQLHGGGVIRIRPDGTGLEVVSTGECNPLSVALSATDDVFTYGNDDDSKQWPNSLTHHIVGGHYGYPYQFLTSPRRALPILSGQFGGAGAQGVCYNEDGLPAEYRGNLFFCDWGLQKVDRIVVRRNGGTFAIAKRTSMVTKGTVDDFRPFSLAVAADGNGFWLVDWGYNGWLDGKVKTGRLYRLRYKGPGASIPTRRPSGQDHAAHVLAMDHPSLSVRLESQRMVARLGPVAVPDLIARLKARGPDAGRLHAVWALDAIGGPEARQAIGTAMTDPSSRVRLQAARSAGIRRDREALPALVGLLKDRDAAVRREAAIAIGKLGDRSAAAALYAALDESDRFAAWSVRGAIRRLDAWDKDALVAALLDERRAESALELTDEAWAVPVADALTEALRRSDKAAMRVRIVANLAGLFRQYPEWSGEWFGTNPLAGPAPEKTRNWTPAGMQAVADGLALGLFDRDGAVRAQAIAGLAQVGRDAAPLLGAVVLKEPDPRNQEALADALGKVGDAAALQVLAALLTDAARPEPVRAAALRGLSSARDPQSLRTRLGLIYDPKAPPTLVAAALPALAHAGILPPNDLISFMQSPTAPVRAAALLSLNVRRPLPEDVKQVVLDRLDDDAPEVRDAAILAVVACRINQAVPRLLALAGRSEPSVRAQATAALCRLPDPRAVSVYLAAIRDRDDRLRRSAESALVAIRDCVPDQIAAAAKSTEFSGPAALSLERVLARFEPIREWRAIGPFPRTTPQLFFGERSINFSRTYVGAAGQTVSWTIRRADPATGQLDLEQMKGGKTERAGCGYEPGDSPDLCAFAYAEVDSGREGPGLMLLGSSGTLIVTVNEQVVSNDTQPAGRAYTPDADLVRFHLARGRNRILVLSRQGIGRWAFGVQIARSRALAGTNLAGTPTTQRRTEELRQFAMSHDGDARRGEALFFDSRRLDCGRCHSAGGRGTATTGPDLTGLALKYDRAELIRSVLEPSSRIAVGYQPVVVATHGGRVISGIVRSETAESIELVDAEAKSTRIPKRDVDVRRAGGVSIMPAQVAESLSPAEFADLITYLASLKQPPPRQPPSPTPSVP